MRIWVRRRRFWWSAINPDEPLGQMDTNRVFRARTKQRAAEKCLAAFTPQPSPWEELEAFEVRSDATTE